MKPKITVLMPVYNTEKYLREAMDSILNQTFKDFEFLIINDSSTDNSKQIILSYKDPRIKYFENIKNLGVARTLNKGLGLAKGVYIARMDADDVSSPHRLTKQVDFMNHHPKVVVCGSWVMSFGETKRALWVVPSDHRTIKSLMLFHSMIYHPTVLIRASVLKNNRLYYNPSFLQSEDYEFWVRIIDRFKIYNLQEPLVYRRIHSDRKDNYFRDREILDWADKIRLSLLHKLGIYPCKKEFEIHRAISCWRSKADKEFIEAAELWLNKLVKSNNKKRDYFRPTFSKVIAEKWFFVCGNAVRLGFWTWRTFWKSPLSNNIDLSYKKKVVFALRCAARR